MSKVAPFVGARSRRMLLIGGGIVVTLSALVVIASAVEHLRYSGAVLPGVRVEDNRLGGKKDAEVRTALERLSSELQTTPIHAHAGTQTFTVDPSLIGYRVDAEATMRNAVDAGRRSNPLSLVTDTVLRRLRPEVVPLVVNYDAARFQGLLDGWANALRNGLVEGNLEFVGTKVVPVAPHAGRGLLRADAERAMVNLLGDGSNHDIQLPVGDVLPTVDQAAVDAAAARARAMLTGIHLVVAGTTHVSLAAAQIAPALGTRIVGHKLDLTLAADKLRFALGAAFSVVEQPTVDATFDVSSSNTVTVVPSRDGHQLDLAAVAAAILRGDRSIVASVRVEHPAHDTAWARKLGVTHQVSSFTTNYIAGEPRVHNIHLAADTLNNTVVEPGKTFSLNDKLGPRTPEKGYVSAPIILEDGFGEDYGGGISQLTTTLFNAVFFGGYVDVDHSPHRFYISRYPMGREATIVFPYVDLKFRNDTKHGVLIRASYSDTSITVSFYGDTDGRVATEANRKILHTEPITDRLVACPAQKPTDDPRNACAHLSAFARETVAGGETGYDVEFDRVIEQPGHPTVSQHYRVHYPMLQNTVLVGTTPAPSTTTSAPKTPTTQGHTPTSAPRPGAPSTPTSHRP
jgi:vancomycin resistance protein YoaR